MNLDKNLKPGDVIYLLQSKDDNLSYASLKIAKKICEETEAGSVTKLFVVNSSGKEWEFQLPENAEVFCNYDNFVAACLSAAAVSTAALVERATSWCRVPVRSELRKDWTRIARRCAHCIRRRRAKQK